MSGPPRQKSASERLFNLATSLMLTHFDLDSKNAQHREVYSNYLMGLPGPKIIKREQTRESKFVRALVVGILEIQTTHQIVLKVRKYFRRAPQGTSEFKSDYLAFVLHSYLNELYILEQRMGTYLKKLSRAASRGSEVQERLRKITPVLLKVVDHAFEGIRTTRGSHVHEQRFRDEEVGRLSSLELLLKGKEFRNRAGDISLLETFYRSELRRIKKSWEIRFANNELAIETLLEQYFEVILDAIATKDDSLRSFL